MNTTEWVCCGKNTGCDQTIKLIKQFWDLFYSFYDAGCSIFSLTDAVYPVEIPSLLDLCPRSLLKGFEVIGGISYGYKLSY